MPKSINGVLAASVSPFDVIVRVNKVLATMRDTTPKRGARQEMESHITANFSIRQSNFYDTDQFEIVVNFYDGTEARKLFIFFGFQNEHLDVSNEYKVVFSLGDWGNAERIIRLLLEVHKDLGLVFMQGDNELFYIVGGQKPTEEYLNYRISYIQENINSMNHGEHLLWEERQYISEGENEINGLERMLEDVRAS